MRCLLPAFVVLAVALPMSTAAVAQESGAASEMKVLERLLGTWRVENITKIPEASRSTSIAKREFVLDGRFVQELGGFDDEGNPSHRGMYTYDANRKAYRYWFFHESGFYFESTGTWDESRKTFTFVSDLGGGATSTFRVRFLDVATLDWSIISKNAGGEVSFHAEGKAVRQK